MQILKRNKGIDFKATNTDLHGHVQIQLRDAVTGKITEQVEKDNFFTIGLNSAMNKCPFGLDRQDMAYAGVNGVDFKITPVITQLLGGITLYPQSLGDDANVLFPPFTNAPTGYASIDSYTQSDSHQGTWDSVSSGEITGGYRYVYDWGSAFGNGVIAAVALNPRGSHNWMRDLTTALSSGDGTNYQSTGSNGIGLNGFPGNDTGTYIRAVSSHGIFFRRGGSNGAWCFARVKPFAIDLINPYGGAAGFLDNMETVFELPLASYGDNWQFIGNQLANISRNGATITVVLINLADGSVDSTDTYTFSANFGSTHGCITNGYFYCSKSGGGSIYKCNLSNVADVTEIEHTAIRNNDRCYDVGSNWVYSDKVIIDSANDIAQEITNPANGFDWQNNYSYPMWEHGIWLVSGSTYQWYNNLRQIGAVMKKWACMTHANLDNAVTKTADKQMIVNYSITQQ